MSSLQCDFRNSFSSKSRSKRIEIPDLTGKVALVTGTNTGIGKETARVLLTKNAKVWIACRDVAKGEAALKELKERTGRDAHLLKLNLANLRSIKEAAKEFLSKETQLHVLFNNAGVMHPPVELLTDDGYDLQFGTNVLGHFYLTKLLLPTLLSTATSSPVGTVRVVNTSSTAHWLGSLDFDTFKDTPKRRAQGTLHLYNQSKAANIVFSKELHRRYGDQGIVSISVSPGAIATEILRNNASIIRLLSGVVLYHVSYSVLTQLYAGTSPEAVTLSGQHLVPWARVGKCRSDTPNLEKNCGLIWRSKWRTFETVCVRAQ
ncbi:NAD(P)-binding protein [Pisolithus albus]|nr:NAD(P)-binding protein [Pisolithus albus]